MIKLKTLIDVLVSLLLCRILIKGASIGDALAFVSLSGCYAYHEYLTYAQKSLDASKKEDPSKPLLDRLDAIEKRNGNTESKIAAMTMTGRGLR